MPPILRLYLYFHEPAAAEAGHEPRLALPARYSGQPGKCKIFLAQCQNYFNTLPSQFAAESRRIGFIIALLDGQALEWAGPLLDKNSDIIRSLDKLKIELISVFDHNTTDQEAAVRLVNLIQGKKSVARVFHCIQIHRECHRVGGSPLDNLLSFALSQNQLRMR